MHSKASAHSRNYYFSHIQVATQNVNLTFLCKPTHPTLKMLSVSYQGSYGSWKTWKVMEFQYYKIQVWKSWKINSSHGKSWKIEILHNINKVFYLFQFTSYNNNMNCCFQFTSHNNNMNCCYITDFCKSEVNFVNLLYLLLLKY